MHGLRTGQVATQAGVKVETLRYYERAGLLDTLPHTASRYRAYPAETVSRLRFIRRAEVVHDQGRASSSHHLPPLL